VNKSNDWRSIGPILMLLGLVGLSAVSGCRRGPARGTESDPLRPAGARPNIILVMVDTLRADRLGVYGHRGGLSPTLDEIAAEGVTFDRLIAPSSWTQPSIASLFTSRYPSAHKVMMNLHGLSAAAKESPAFPVLRDDLNTLAELLQREKFLTGAFVANPLILEQYGFAQGFDHYDTSFALDTTLRGGINEAAADWLAQRDTGKPFFLYLHYMELHATYDAPAAFLNPLLEGVEALPDKHELNRTEREALGYLDSIPEQYADVERHRRLSRYREYWVARYEAGLVEFDHRLADLRSRLQKMDLWEDAYVVITADHGEALLEHGHWAHGWSAHHPELHVPLLIRWKGVLPANQRVGQTASLIDVLPTLLDQLNLPLPIGIQGQSLLQYVGVDDAVEAGPVFAEAVALGPEQRAVYAHPWKLIHNLQTSKKSLYQIENDPLEQDDLADDYPQRVAILVELIRDQIKVNAQFAAGAETQVVPVTEQQRQRLKALGYTD